MRILKNIVLFLPCHLLRVRRAGPRQFEFRFPDDIRFQALRFDNFSVGPIAGRSFARDEDDSNRLRGLGDIDGGLVLSGFASYEFFNSGNVNRSADIGLSTQVTGDAFDQSRFSRANVNDDFGYAAHFSLSGEDAINEQFNVAMRQGTIYALDDNMQTHFG
ncbi:MAG: MipA/OmpV family protein, partial [Rhizobiaceae bacterium]